MNILRTNQYNQGISKFKLLSSNAGVGSIITTKLGYYILVSDITKWDFIQAAQNLLKEIVSEESDSPTKQYERAKNRIPNQGLELIDDKRFVEFLKGERDVPNLICLIGIPSISLNEQFNSPNWSAHPINRKFEGKFKAENFMVKGTHFPKWFRNEKNEFKTYNEWKRIWNAKNLKTENFVPPRDATSPIKDQKGNDVFKQVKDQDNVSYQLQLFKELSQSNLILICPNGHLSDIPWPKFLKWKSERSEGRDDAKDLFSVDPCCSTPNLIWTESKTKSEGYGSIYLECLTCGTGSGKDNRPKTSLEGINNIKPFCPGHKPWEIGLGQDSVSAFPHEECYVRSDKSSGKERMQLALVTGNNIYYAHTFSSLYIPQYLAENKSKELLDAIIKCQEKYKRHLKARRDLSKREFWNQLNKEDFLIDSEIAVNDIPSFISSLQQEFLEIIPPDVDDKYEFFRWQEYRCFSSRSSTEEKGLKFNDIKLPIALKNYFDKIQQVRELRLTQVQLDFTRVRPGERVKVENKVFESSNGQNVFASGSDEILTLPANETLGEGLFFRFNDNQINIWAASLPQWARERYQHFFGDVNFRAQGGPTKQRIKNNGIKHFLIHTFSHLVMRELEFSCGYPTASLKERLYLSDRMSGVLIYTAEGSEGSMGGLIWQGQPERINQLIAKALERSFNCSSDPLCWESEGQGVFDLNLSACFSCSLVSETACEESNLGLDRRALIDPNFGYFKKGIPYSLIDLTNEFVSRNFGSNRKWSKISETLMEKIETNEKRSVGLSEIIEISKNADVDLDDVLSVVGLLSNPEENIIKAEFHSLNNEPIDAAQVYSKFAEYWRGKSVSKEEWEQWSSKILVKWKVND